MTKGYLKTDPIAWEQAVTEFEAARAACDAANPSKADATYDRYQETEEALLAIPAPDLEAVIEKLLIIWENELAIETPDSI